MNARGRVFLITTPSHDDVTYYCSEWSKEIIDEARRKGFEVVHLPDEKATRSSFEGHVRKQKPSLVMFNGHGSPEQITGFKNEPLLKKGDNEKLMRGRVVYARSCFALSELGVACENTGAKGFISYSLPFSFISDPNRSAHPLKDELAHPCLLTSNMIPLSLIKGRTVSEAVDKARSKMKELIHSWEVRQDVPEASFVASCLHWNMIGLGFHGNPDAKV